MSILLTPHDLLVFGGLAVTIVAFQLMFWGSLVERDADGEEENPSAPAIKSLPANE